MSCKSQLLRSTQNWAGRLRQGASLSLGGSVPLRAGRRARVPVVDQALRLLVAHVRVPLAEAQAHYIVVHFIPDLLAFEAPGEVLVRGEQLLQVFFHVRDVALQLVSTLGKGRDYAAGRANRTEQGQRGTVGGGLTRLGQMCV